MKKYFELRDHNLIKIYTDNSCSMAMVEVNDNCVMMGSYWNFHNDCYGMHDVKPFSSYLGLVNLIKEYIDSNDKKYDIQNIKWNYGRWNSERSAKQKEVLFKGGGALQNWEMGFYITKNNHLCIYEYSPEDEPDKVIHIPNKDLGKLFEVLRDYVNKMGV